MTTELSETALAELVCTRLSHDIIGNIGAVSNAVELLEEVQKLRESGSSSIPWELLQRNVKITDSNAAFFDPSHGFAGCIPGIHEVLRRQGLLLGTWCLNPAEVLSPGQSEEIDRVYAAYPELNDDAFVAANLEDWLNG